VAKGLGRVPSQVIGKQKKSIVKKDASFNQYISVIVQL